MFEAMKFEVTVTSHDMLKGGVCEVQSRFVVIYSDDYVDARVAAAQFVLAMEAIYQTGLDMVTNAYPIF